MFRAAGLRGRGGFPMRRATATALAGLSAAAAAAAILAAAGADGAAGVPCRAPLERFLAAAVAEAAVPGAAGAEKEAAGADLLARGCPAGMVLVGAFAARDAARRRAARSPGEASG